MLVTRHGLSRGFDDQVGGQREMQGWFSKWTLDLAAKNEAIVVTADYRLIPEVCFIFYLMSTISCCL